VIERKVLLQGKISRKNFIYAESILVTKRLEPKFRDELLKSQIPMGRLWLEHKIETFKEIIDSSQELAKDLSNYFKIQREDRMLSRTYRVFSNHQPIMVITEKFPESYFLKDF
jgi:chorismate-pyruvate lyase